MFDLSAILKIQWLSSERHRFLYSCQSGKVDHLSFPFTRSFRKYVVAASARAIATSMSIYS